MATLESHLSGISIEQLQGKIAELKDIIAMRKTGASNLEIGKKYGSYPDNPERDILLYKRVLADRGVTAKGGTVQQAGMFSNKNITIAIVAIIVVILINRL